MKTGRIYTREDIVSKLNEQVRQTEKQWGVDYIYSKWAREARDQKLAEYDSGKVIVVEKESYFENHMDFQDEFMSDGTVQTTCYGFSD